MIKINKPIQLHKSLALMSGAETFSRRIKGNYDIFSAGFNTEKLLFLLKGEDVEAEEQTLLTTIINNNFSTNNISLSIDLFNQFLNRIAVICENKITYQDNVFISQFLRKAGINNVDFFVRKLQQYISETKYAFAVRNVFDSNKKSLNTLIDVVNSRKSNTHNNVQNQNLTNKNEAKSFSTSHYEKSVYENVWFQYNDSKFINSLLKKYDYNSCNELSSMYTNLSNDYYDISSEIQTNLGHINQLWNDFYSNSLLMKMDDKNNDITVKQYIMLKSPIHINPFELWQPEFNYDVKKQVLSAVLINIIDSFYQSAFSKPLSNQINNNNWFFSYNDYNELLVGTVKRFIENHTLKDSIQYISYVNQNSIDKRKKQINGLLQIVDDLNQSVNIKIFSESVIPENVYSPYVSLEDSFVDVSDELSDNSKQMDDDRIINTANQFIKQQLNNLVINEHSRKKPDIKRTRSDALKAITNPDEFINQFFMDTNISERVEIENQNKHYDSLPESTKKVLEAVNSFLKNPDKVNSKVVSDKSEALLKQDIENIFYPQVDFNEFSNNTMENNKSVTMNNNVTEKNDKAILDINYLSESNDNSFLSDIKEEKIIYDTIVDLTNNDEFIKKLESIQERKYIDVDYMFENNHEEDNLFLNSIKLMVRQMSSDVEKNISAIIKRDYSPASLSDNTQAAYQIINRDEDDSGINDMGADIYSVQENIQSLTPENKNVLKILKEMIIDNTSVDILELEPKEIEILKKALLILHDDKHSENDVVNNEIKDIKNIMSTDYSIKSIKQLINQIEEKTVINVHEDKSTGYINELISDDRAVNLIDKISANETLKNDSLYFNSHNNYDIDLIENILLTWFTEIPKEKVSELGKSVFIDFPKEKLSTKEKKILYNLYESLINKIENRLNEIKDNTYEVTNTIYDLSDLNEHTEEQTVNIDNVLSFLNELIVDENTINTTKLQPEEIEKIKKLSLTLYSDDYYENSIVDEAMTDWLNSIPTEKTTELLMEHVFKPILNNHEIMSFYTENDFSKTVSEKLVNNASKGITSFIKQYKVNAEHNKSFSGISNEDIEFFSILSEEISSNNGYVINGINNRYYIHMNTKTPVEFVYDIKSSDEDEDEIKTRKSTLIENNNEFTITHNENFSSESLIHNDEKNVMQNLYNNSFNSQNIRNISDNSSVNIQNNIEKILEKHISTITEKVYSRLEKKMQSERKRRGY